MVDHINQEPAAEYSTAYEDNLLAQARTILAKRLRISRDVMTSAEHTKQFCGLELYGKEREVFGVLFLDNQNRLIEYVEMFQGTIDGASVYPREVVRKALLLNAVSLVLTHNHPSGISKPSEADKRITKRIQAACELLDLRVLDHIVVGEDNFSFAEAGLM